MVGRRRARVILQAVHHPTRSRARRSISLTTAVPARTPDTHPLRNALLLAAIATVSLVLSSLAFAAPALASPPVDEVPPSIGGEPVVGHELVGAPGTWSEEHPPNEYQYEWRECQEENTSACQPVDPADTTSTYRVTGSARDNYIVLSVKTVDHEGHAGSPAYSNFLGPVTQSASTAVQTNESLSKLFVHSIDNSTHTVELNDYAALDSHAATGLEHALSAADGSSQRYALYESDGTTPVTGAIATGDVLVVTAENGTTKQAYTLTVEAPAGECTAQGECAANFAATCSTQHFIVPNGVTELSFTVVGGGGGGAEGSGSEAVGGAGGSTSGKLAVTPGEELTLLVGSGGAGSPSGANPVGAAGGCYGGGSVGGGGEEAGAGGGGGSFLIAADGLVAAAGGGGGAGIGANGGAGGQSGENGAVNGDEYELAGGGATDLVAGAGGIGPLDGVAGSGPATPTEPGAGGSTPVTLAERSGGAGGGGYYGGGSGASDDAGGNAAGGGGSDYTALATPTTYDTDRVPGGEGLQDGDNGYIQLSWRKAVTEPPVLTAPGNNAEPEGAFPIDFTLPEAALANSVTLAFTELANPHNAYVYTLKAAAAEAYEVNFNPAHPTSGALEKITSGPAHLPYGSYSLVVFYQDEVGNPQASTTPVDITVLDPKCAAGSYSATGLEPCEQAASGHYVSTRGATTETTCPGGTYDPDQGSTSPNACVDTEAGHAAAPGSASQVECAPGFYQPQRAQEVCLPADIGHYVPGAAAIAQIACPAGYFTELIGSENCLQAPAGHYAAGEGTAFPSACPAGTYDPTPASTSASACVPSPAGSYSGEGASEPTPCPAGTESTIGSSGCTEIKTQPSPSSNEQPSERHNEDASTPGTSGSTGQSGSQLTTEAGAIAPGVAGGAANPRSSHKHPHPHPHRRRRAHRKRRRRAHKRDRRRR